ncbi:hypothetical protein F4560_000864 [Saccharothrix ecbatanensis]|uniref:Uncharacterized protein n=1 Tax=Saccharothrix ecbatanensis TaxID=1105145 RepID=A0A7W9HFN7_9PSEU|nr:hypothetical protein [Saccharothrix ecbatanensis]MBB5801096.1 hypothetical protein [Saccharothrix ecbatanensis]
MVRPAVEGPQRQVTNGRVGGRGRVIAGADHSIALPTPAPPTITRGSSWIVMPNGRFSESQFQATVTTVSAPSRVAGSQAWALPTTDGGPGR